MAKIIVTATSFLDELQTHPPEEGEPKRRLEEAAALADVEVEYRCDRDPRTPMTADELEDAVAVIADLEHYDAEVLAARGAGGGGERGGGMNVAATAGRRGGTAERGAGGEPAAAEGARRAGGGDRATAGDRAAAGSHAPGLALISRYGIGVDAIDLPAARSAGVAVCNAPGANARPTAEWTLATILDIAGRRTPHHERAAAGRRKSGPSRIDLTGTTVGIVGTGHVGMLMAELLAPFQVELIASDRGDEREWIEKYDVEMVTLHALCRRADVVTLHASAKEQLIGPEEFDLMTPTTCLVNCARGYLVDNREAWRRVKEGLIWGYGIDEVWPEADLPLDGLNIVASPHVGSDSDRGKLGMQRMSVDRVIEFLEGRPLKNVVNPA